MKETNVGLIGHTWEHDWRKIVADPTIGVDDYWYIGDAL
jgi:hypothetical protein